MILSMITNFLVKKQENLTSNLNGWMAGYLVRMVLFLLTAVFFSLLKITPEEKNNAIILFALVVGLGMVIETFLSALQVKQKSDPIA